MSLFFQCVCACEIRKKLNVSRLFENAVVIGYFLFVATLASGVREVLGIGIINLRLVLISSSAQIWLMFLKYFLGYLNPSDKRVLPLLTFTAFAAFCMVQNYQGAFVNGSQFYAGAKYTKCKNMQGA